MGEKKLSRACAANAPLLGARRSLRARGGTIYMKTDLVYVLYMYCTGMSIGERRGCSPISLLCSLVARVKTYFKLGIRLA